MIKVNNEIGKLKKVMLHRPGKELENLTPDSLERLLFDDIPWLEKAQEEHDAFADTLRKLGVEVVYLVDLAAESLINESVKSKFIEQFVEEATSIKSDRRQKQVIEYLSKLDNKTLISTCIAGIRRSELPTFEKITLRDYEEDHRLFVCDPMPNAYFTRDPFASIYNGVSINRMRYITRRRETIFAEYIFTYHKDYKNTKKFFNRDDVYALEGGDMLVINKHTLAIGVSQRTDAGAIERIANNIFNEKDNEFTTMLAFSIPNTRAFMHLDTVFTQIDHDAFTIHGGIEGPLVVYELIRDKNGKTIINVMEDDIEEILKKYIGKEVKLYRCADGNNIAAQREQWSDGANTLCISPGEVVVYSRNTVTNQLLEENGVKIHVIPSSELSRGRGGPRCMSMPLVREDL